MGPDRRVGETSAERRHGEVSAARESRHVRTWSAQRSRHAARQEGRHPQLQHGGRHGRRRVRREPQELALEPVGADDEVVCFGDIIGGSPLTNTLNTLTEKGLLPKTTAFGGMNLPMAITAAMGMETPIDALKGSIISEGQEAIRELELQMGEEDEDEI